MSGKQKHMGKRLVLKPEVVSMFGVMYPFESNKKFLKRLTETLSTESFK